MKHMIIPALLFLIIASISVDNHVYTNGSAVNAIIGDASFIATFSVEPDATADEDLRLVEIVAEIHRRHDRLQVLEVVDLRVLQPIGVPSDDQRDGNRSGI